MSVKKFGELPLEFLTVPGAKTTATVIFLHGAGNWSGKTQKEQIIELLGDEAFIPHVKFIFPSSPVTEFVRYNKVMANWFNAYPKHEFSVEELLSSMEYIESIYREEVQRGTDPSRVILGGSSQGACVAMTLAYTRLTEVRAVAGHACMYLPTKYEVPSNTKLPELYQTSWTKDNYIPFEFSKDSFYFLKSKGVKGTFSVKDGEGHAYDKEQLMELYSFIKKMLPP